MPHLVITAVHLFQVYETPFYVAVDHEKKKVVISIRGTLSPKVSAVASRTFGRSGKFFGGSETFPTRTWCLTPLKSVTPFLPGRADRPDRGCRAPAGRGAPRNLAGTQGVQKQKKTHPNQTKKPFDILVVGPKKSGVNCLRCF